MRERKYVKFRVDMHEDTKFKIIDMKPERDVIHYVWNRIVLLAGKVNLEGDLYLSKNIPYIMNNISFRLPIYYLKFSILMHIYSEFYIFSFSHTYQSPLYLYNTKSIFQKCSYMQKSSVL